MLRQFDGGLTGNTKLLHCSSYYLATAYAKRGATVGMLQQLPTPSPLIAKRSFSKIGVWVTLSMASGSGLIVRLSYNTLVANVAEFVLAFSAHK